MLKNHFSNKCKLTLTFIYAISCLGLTFFASQSAYADILCMKKNGKVNNNSVDFSKSIKKFTTANCPSGFSLLLNLGNLIDGTGDFPTTTSSKTYVGTFSTGGLATAANHLSASTISFPFPLASAPSAVAANIIAAGGASTANCPGTVTNPSAQPGHLCIYVGAASNVAAHAVWDPTSATGAVNTASKFGGSLYAYSTAAGSFYSWGTWAVTTP